MSESKDSRPKVDGWKGMHNGKITDPRLRESRSNRKTHAQRRADSVARNTKK